VEEQYRTMANSAQTGVYIIQDGLLCFVNPYILAYSGYPEEELIGESILQFVHPDDRTMVREMARKMLAGVLTTPYEYRIVDKNNQVRWFMETVTPISYKGMSAVLGNTMDTTERKWVEEARRSSEQRLSDIIEFLPDATLVVNRDGKVIAWNRAIEEMTGIKAEDMLGKGDYEYALPFYGERRSILIDLALHPEPEREKSYTNIERKGDILFGEAYTPGLIGGKTHLSATASVLRNAKGEIVAAIECIRDNTGRRHAQENLRQAEERYRSIFENAQEGIYRSTPGGRIIMANPAMAKIFGYASPEEIMSGITDVARQLYVDPEDRTKIRQIIEEQGFVRNYETQLYRKDGSIIWISITMRAIRDEKGQLLYYEGMDEDITNRKESAERMRKALGATVQAMAVTVETRDPYTAGHQRRVADLARSIATEMNLSTDQIDGIRMAAIIHDLGKISVPAEILSKPTKLTALEFSLIKTHAQSGYDILKDIDFPWPIARMVLEHHERMDGSGYPNGLIAEETLLESRILAVADVVESMASHRPYRPALGIDAALKEIEKNRGALYDTGAVDACVRLFREKGFQLP
jgi:PAS domain S-box-containing protein